MNYLFMVLCGVLGILIYSAVKINKINSRYDSVDIPIVINLFLKKEVFALFISFLAVITMAIITFSLFRMRNDGIPLPWAPTWLNDLWPYFINPIFVLVGISGNWALISVFNGTEKYIKKTSKDIDEKIKG